MTLIPNQEYIHIINWKPQLPKDWNIHKIKFLLSRPVTDGPHETPEFIEEGVPFLSVDSIQDGKLIFENCRYISKEDFTRFKVKCKPQRDDVFLGKAASIGKIAIVDVDFEFGIWSPLALLRPNKKKILPKFLEFSLKANYNQDQIDLFATSNTQKNISMDDIPSIQLIIPPIEEQKQIANYLDKKITDINNLLEKDKHLIKLLKEKRIALIRHIITKGINPKVKFKDSGIDWIGKIPEEWNTKKVKLFSRVITGATPDSGNDTYWDGDIIWVTPADLSTRDKYISDSKRKITKEGYLNCGTNFVGKGDIILATRAPIGYPTIVNEKLCFNQGCKAIKILKECISEYCYYYLNAYEEVLNSKGNA
ncbi:MAG: restriction endonuclease subunit S, partial [Candidatus Pacearchaeota archaeon]|nr:restriction endonuclease subunit S [Candidatus Pacearchaeota archaeon]